MTQGMVKPLVYTNLFKFECETSNPNQNSAMNQPVPSNEGKVWCSEETTGTFDVAQTLDWSITSQTLLPTAQSF